LGPEFDDFTTIVLFRLGHFSRSLDQGSKILPIPGPSTIVAFHVRDNQIRSPPDSVGLLGDVKDRLDEDDGSPNCEGSDHDHDANNQATFRPGHSHPPSLEPGCCFNASLLVGGVLEPAAREILSLGASFQNRSATSEMLFLIGIIESFSQV